jgi:hypothetical protein
MTHLQVLRKGIFLLLSWIGFATVLLLLGVAGLRILGNHTPDSIGELISPDGRHRMVITEDLVGFPGSFCIKQVYVLGAHDTFNRNDEDNQVYAGACDGLSSIAWDGARILGTVTPNAAVAGVNSMRLKGYGANGEVRLSWLGR